jgi:hypothetical protein
MVCSSASRVALRTVERPPEIRSRPTSRAGIAESASEAATIGSSMCGISGGISRREPCIES